MMVDPTNLNPLFWRSRLIQVGQCGFARHFLERFQFIVYGLSIDESPNVPVEGSEPLPDYDESFGVADCRVDFESVADYSAVLEQGCDFAGTVFRDFIKIEVVKRLTEVFPFIQDGAPAQAGLKAFEDQEFEQFQVVMDRSAPFLIMVLGHENIIRTPAIRLVFFHDLAVNDERRLGPPGSSANARQQLVRMRLDD